MKIHRVYILRMEKLLVFKVGHTCLRATEKAMKLNTGVRDLWRPFMEQAVGTKEESIQVERAILNDPRLAHFRKGKREVFEMNSEAGMELLIEVFREHVDDFIVRTARNQTLFPVD